MFHLFAVSILGIQFLPNPKRIAKSILIDLSFKNVSHQISKMQNSKNELCQSFQWGLSGLAVTPLLWPLNDVSKEGTFNFEETTFY